MVVALWFFVGFLIGGCAAGTAMSCSLLKHCIGRKKSKEE